MTGKRYVALVIMALMLSFARAADGQSSVAQACNMEAQGFCLEGPVWRGINCLAYAMYGCATTKRDRDYCEVTSKTIAPHIGADKATVEKLVADCMSGKETTLGHILDARERKSTPPRGRDGTDVGETGG